MEKHIPFSVCICVYHRDDPRWFRQAMESILNQTVVPDEVILVVDGPVGQALEAVIAGFEKLDNVRTVRLAVNQGLGNARREGLSRCSYELVAMMDSDDLSVPDRFAQQLAVFEKNPGISVVGGQIAEFVGDVDDIVGIRNVPCSDEEIRRDLKKRCPFNHMTVMVRKADVIQAGGYLDWFYNEDYYLWIRMYLAGQKFANVPEVLVNVRVGEDMYRRRGGWKYFRSELGIQNLMLSHKIIGPEVWAVNVAKRVIVQVLLPNRIRGWVFQKFARNQKETEK